MLSISEKMKKKLIQTALSIIILLFEFWICRYVFFQWHGMKQFPFFLLTLGSAVVLIAAIFSSKAMSVAALLGYILGFFSNMILRSYGIDPGGGRTSNGWIIWGGIFLTFVLLGIVIEIVQWKKKK